VCQPRSAAVGPGSAPPSPRSRLRSSSTHGWRGQTEMSGRDTADWRRLQVTDGLFRAREESDSAGRGGEADGGGAPSPAAGPRAGSEPDCAERGRAGEEGEESERRPSFPDPPSPDPPSPDPPSQAPPQPRSRRRRAMAGEPGWPWTSRAVDREVPQPQPLTLLEASAAARGCPLHHRDGRGRDDFSDCKKWVNCSGWEIVWEPGCKVGADTAGSVDTTGGSCAGTWQPGSGRDAIGGSLAVVSCVESARSTRDLLRPRLPDPGV
jgi:hypothetical protein